MSEWRQKAFGPKDRPVTEAIKMTEHTKIISYSNEIVEELKKLQPAGCWVISSSFRVEVKAKPNWFHRLMARLLLGWKWQDRK